jgi:hypothetical protein
MTPMMAGARHDRCLSVALSTTTQLQVYQVAANSSKYLLADTGADSDFVATTIHVTLPAASDAASDAFRLQLEWPRIRLTSRGFIAVLQHIRVRDGACEEAAAEGGNVMQLGDTCTFEGGDMCGFGHGEPVATWMPRSKHSTMTFRPRDGSYCRAFTLLHRAAERRAMGRRHCSALAASMDRALDDCIQAACEAGADAINFFPAADSRLCELLICDITPFSATEEHRKGADVYVVASGEHSSNTL